ncbi:MAG: PIN domain-containing protein [Acidobacteria bacterium]|nr:PIN domain-containing protein [Acidobacteriota bacterium]MCZ6726368.1 PIN domain-containing protein [Acidobacteriota bacterium]
MSVSVPSGNVFVDTNVLVYSRDASEAEKQPLASAWLLRLWESRRGRLSVQVLNEFYVTVTRKLDPGMSAEQARADVRDLRSWEPIDLDTALIETAWSVQDRFVVSFWDSLIVAAAQTTQCRYLLTEDLQEGQLFSGVEVVNPFRRPPSELLLT